MMVPGETCWRIERALEYAVFVDAATTSPPSSRRFCAPSAGCCSSAGTSTRVSGWTRAARRRGRDDRLGHGARGGGAGEPAAGDRRPPVGHGDACSPRPRSQRRSCCSTAAPDRLTFTVDHHHPLGAAHHQKIVVIDDCLAFAGGIDVTADRWDTSEHLDARTRIGTGRGRGVRPGRGTTSTSLMSGPAARAVGDLARERWESGTGRAAGADRRRGALLARRASSRCSPMSTSPSPAPAPSTTARSWCTRSSCCGWPRSPRAAQRLHREPVLRQPPDRRGDRRAAARGRRPGVSSSSTRRRPEGWLSEKAMGTARAKLLDDGRARPTCTTGSGSTCR